MVMIIYLNVLKAGGFFFYHLEWDLKNEIDLFSFHCNLHKLLLSWTETLTNTHCNDSQFKLGRLSWIFISGVCFSFHFKPGGWSNHCLGLVLSPLQFSHLDRWRAYQEGSINSGHRKTFLGSHKLSALICCLQYISDFCVGHAGSVKGWRCFTMALLLTAFVYLLVYQSSQQKVL